MKYFRILLECGHFGAGNRYDVVRYFAAKDLITIIDRLKSLPRLKNRERFTSIKSIEVIDRKTFMNGKSMERQDPYLRSRKKILKRLIKDTDAHRCN